jgi:hypothetical protein
MSADSCIPVDAVSQSLDKDNRKEEHYLHYITVQQQHSHEQQLEPPLSSSLSSEPELVEPEPGLSDSVGVAELCC